MPAPRKAPVRRTRRRREVDSNPRSLSLDSRGGEGAEVDQGGRERRRPFSLGGPAVRIPLPPPASPPPLRRLPFEEATNGRPPFQSSPSDVLHPCCSFCTRSQCSQAGHEAPMFGC